MTDALLQINELTKSFGGIRAVDAVTISLTKSGISGLIGPNGSGKTTLFNLVTGYLRPDRGIVTFDGVNITGWPAHKVAMLGLRRTFQYPRVFSSLTVMENISLGCARKAEAEDKMKSLLEDLGLYESRKVLAGKLPFGQRKLLELLRVIASNAKCVLFDELVAGLTEDERSLVTNEIEKMVKEGTRIVIVEHNIEFTMSTCEQIYVLDHGRLISQGSPAEISLDRRVAEVYLGEQ